MSHVTRNVTQNTNAVTGLMGEHKSAKNSHLMIFMRALLTDRVQVCPVKAYRTELATTCPCMTLTEIHNSEIQRMSTRDIANEIHDPIMIFMICPTRVETHKGLDKCFGLDSILACLLLLNFCPHIVAPLPTIRDSYNSDEKLEIRLNFVKQSK